MDFSKIVGAFCLYQVLHKLVASKGKSEFITTKSCKKCQTQEMPQLLQTWRQRNHDGRSAKRTVRRRASHSYGLPGAHISSSRNLNQTNIDGKAFPRWKLPALHNGQPRVRALRDPHWNQGRHPQQSPGRAAAHGLGLVRYLLLSVVKS